MRARQRTIRRVSALGVLLLATIGCADAPQFTGDEECFSAVDALWTAVTARQTPWLDASVQELERLRDAGKLSPEAWKALAGPISQARSGEWEEAAQELYDLIKAQRAQPAQSSQR